MTKPFIGITTDRLRGENGFEYQGLIEKYIEAITNAGGVPIMVPIGVPEDCIDPMLSRLDGILFSGGGDIDPGFYNSNSHSKIRKVYIDRDRMEIHLAKSAFREKKPFLGICRGMQVVNIALGGSLYTDIQEQHPEAIKHDYYPGWPRDYSAHPITISGEGQLSEIIGDESIVVNSLHHQAISQLAPELESVGFAPDGIIEAVETLNHPFGIAVQWHPEWLTDNRVMRLLFERFVNASLEAR